MIRDYRNTASDAWFLSTTEDPSDFPIYFTYEGKKYHGFGDKDFDAGITTTVKEGDKETVILTYLLKNTLSFTLRTAHYYGHGATEWTLETENISDKDSGVIENIYSTLRFEGTSPHTPRLSRRP